MSTRHLVQSMLYLRNEKRIQNNSRARKIAPENKSASHEKETHDNKLLKRNYKLVDYL